MKGFFGRLLFLGLGRAGVALGLGARRGGLVPYRPPARTVHVQLVTDGRAVDLDTPARRLRLLTPSRTVEIA